MSKHTLNSELRKYFASIRTCGGGEVKSSTLVSYKYGLAKHLKEKCSVDINTDPEFTSCRELFKAKLTDLKKKGRGSVDHKPIISTEDLQKLFSNNSLSGGVFNMNTPYGLQRKVWFDIMYFMCRRGQENLRSMTKDTFGVGTDGTGRQYVFQKVDEADKNHRSDVTADQTIGEGRMYSREGDPTCPVLSYKKYIQKLSPDLGALWQRPLDSFLETARVWYCKSPVGKNGLSNMMAEISKRGELSRIYTNHSIRATSITAMDEAGIEARHIMRASGHKSESSIRSYANRLSDSKKRDISSCLSDSLNAVTSSSVSDPKKSNCVDRTVTPLSEEELLNIFSDENGFADFIDNPYNTVSTTSASGMSCVPALTPKDVIDNVANTKSTIPASSMPVLAPVETVSSRSIAVENTTMYSSFLPSMLRSSSFVINPNITNSNVHFHFGNPQ